MLKSRYWDESDDLYVYLGDAFEDGEGAWQVPFDYEHPELGGIVADLSNDGKILGFEFGDARRHLQWSQDADSAKPQVSGAYDRQADEYTLTFGHGGVTSVLVTDAMFPAFAVSVELDCRGRVTQLRVPNASVQLERQP